MHRLLLKDLYVREILGIRQFWVGVLPKPIAFSIIPKPTQIFLHMHPSLPQDLYVSA